MSLSNFSQNKIQTSIIVPAYNEEKGIEKVIMSLKKYLNQRCEIIVVNDGSTDRTKEIIEKIPEIKTIHHPKNLGYGAALKSGIRQAQGEYVLIIDADGTYPSDSISSLLKYKRGYNMVVAARTGSNVKIPVLRKPVKWFFGVLANYLSGIKIPDLNSGLRIMEKNVVKEFFYLLPDGFSFTTTITLAMLTNHYSVKYISINYHKRKGESKIKPIQDTIKFTNLILKTILYFNPLKIFIPISLILFLLSLGVLAYSYLFMPKIMDIATLILFISAIQILAIGMIADLIVKTKK